MLSTMRREFHLLAVARGKYGNVATVWQLQPTHIQHCHTTRSVQTFAVFSQAIRAAERQSRSVKAGCRLHTAEGQRSPYPKSLQEKLCVAGLRSPYLAEVAKFDSCADVRHESALYSSGERSQVVCFSSLLLAVIRLRCIRHCSRLHNALNLAVVEFDAIFELLHLFPRFQSCPRKPWLQRANSPVCFLWAICHLSFFCRRHQRCVCHLTSLLSAFSSIHITCELEKGWCLPTAFRP